MKALCATVAAAVLLVACSSSGPSSDTPSSPPPTVSSQQPYTLPPNPPPTTHPAVTIGYQPLPPFTAGQRFQFLARVRAMHDFKIELSSDKHKVHVGRQICVGLSNGVTPTHMVNGFVHQGVEEDDANQFVQIAVAVLCPSEKKFIGR